METMVIDEVLEKLDFNVKSTYSTLFFTSKSYSSNEILFEEKLILDAAKKLRATAVYFRRFPDNQSSKAQLFVFDNSNLRLSKNELADIHRKIWSAGIVPIYYVFDRTNLHIYDARKQVDYDQVSKEISVSPFDVLSLISASHQDYEKYSAKLFSNGVFWEQKVLNNRFLSKGSSENKLIEGLKKVRTHFIIESGIEKSLAQQLLVLSILVKYLEERIDEKGNHVFPSNYFNKYDGASSFCEILKKGFVTDFFDELSSQFNGKIFELKDTDKAILKNTDLGKLANYLDGSLDGNQLVLWPLYSFDYLPVELISRIYEEFIDQRKDAVFTPIHLARLMVDECMPILEPKLDYKVIDVSCGSGVFLVAVFKRMVQWWQKIHYDKTGEVISPKINNLKDILKNSIYGVDIEEDSVRLSVFSLSIALCDMLTPTEIWTDLRFDDLREKNIYEGNFFKYLMDNEKGRFDLVIGNPPFEDKVKNFDSLISEFNINIPYHIPRNQIAMLFLQQAMKLLKPDGLLSFVMPSGPLLYNNTLDFRKEFFSRYEVPQIIDLSELRDSGVLFEKTIATAVIFAKNRKPSQNHHILHIATKRTKTTRERLFFEIDSYDMNNVSQEVAENDLVVWKSNLVGGYQLYFLIKRFDGLRKLGSFLDFKRRNDDWEVGLGYQIARKTKPAPHLTGHLMVETKDFTEEGVLKTKIENETKFQRSREPNKNIFLAPHLLIKRTIGKNNFTAHLLDYDLIFKERIIGIYAPLNQKEELRLLELTLKENYIFYKLFLMATSAEAGISRSGGYVMYMKDVLNLPYPENKENLSLSISEEIIKADVLNYKLEELSKGEKAKLNTKKTEAEGLEEFGKTFCESLNPIYNNDNKVFKPLAPIETLSYICFPFSYANQELSIDTIKKIKEGDLSGLIENQQESVLYRRVLRLYQKDIIFLIKPKTLRYWLKSVALRDAGDVMIDLVNSGY